MSEMSQSRLRALERQLNSTRETGRLVETSHNRIWLWRQGCANLTQEQQDRLELYLYSKLAHIELAALRGGQAG
ncbi:MAG TPA: hypothetical protein VK728_00865 [Candidatus Sulfotelmatobacter sp.]|jgi:hypothetical protein|nr:hypothetical protein [Candidatus Sulfotelmatobacter sp.]